MGFYMWDGYMDDTVDETGYIPGSSESDYFWIGDPDWNNYMHWGGSIIDSKFTTPQRQYHYDNTQYLNNGYEIYAGMLIGEIQMAGAVLPIRLII